MPLLQKLRSGTSSEGISFMKGSKEIAATRVYIYRVVMIPVSGRFVQSCVYGARYKICSVWSLRCEDVVFFSKGNKVQKLEKKSFLTISYSEMVLGSGFGKLHQSIRTRMKYIYMNLLDISLRRA